MSERATEIDEGEREGIHIRSERATERDSKRERGLRKTTALKIFMRDIEQEREREWTGYPDSPRPSE